MLSSPCHNAAGNPSQLSHGCDGCGSPLSSENMSCDGCDGYGAPVTPSQDGLKQPKLSDVPDRHRRRMDLVVVALHPFRPPISDYCQ